jgi:4-amino-4-deoxy-L-arabinose transferase-like glycosyltransferase
MMMITEYIKNNWGYLAILLVLAIFGLVYRLLANDFGLPTVSHEEYTTLGRVWTSSQSGDLNPHWFGWPSLLFYIELGMLKIMNVFGPVEWNNFVLTIRGLQAVIGALTIPLMYFIVSILFGKRAGLVAAFLVAILPTHIFYSRIARPEIIVPSLYMLTVLFSIYIVKTGKLKYYILAVLCAGLATAAKYNGVFSIIVPVAAHIIYCRLNHAQYGDWKRWAVIVGVPAAAFLITNPFSLADFSTFWNSIVYQSGRADVSLWASLQETGSILIEEMGWPIVALSVVGAAFLIKRHKWPDVLTLIVVVSALALVFVWDPSRRLLIPLMLTLLIIGGLTEAVWQLAIRLKWRPAAAISLVALSALASFYPITFNQDYYADVNKESVSTVVTAWIEANAPPGSRIYWGYNATIPFITKGGKLQYFLEGDTEPNLMYDNSYTAFQKREFDYVILTDKRDAGSKTYTFYKNLYADYNSRQFAWSNSNKSPYGAPCSQYTWQGSGTIYILELNKIAVGA